MLFRTCPRPAPARSCVAFSPPFPIAWILETSPRSRIPISSSRFVCSCRAVTLDRCKKVRKTSSALARNHKKLGTQDPHSASPLLSKPLDFAISKRRASDMGRKNDQGLSRRDFLKLSGSGAFALGAGSGPFFLFPERAAAEQKTLKILQWSHFVPAYDTWFDGTFCKQWGQKNNTNVIIDHINLVDLSAKAASEASAQKGHDLFMLLSPPAAYEKQTIDLAHVYQEVEKKHGRKIDLAHKLVDRSRFPQRPRYLGRPPCRRQENPRQVWPSLRSRALPGTRHQHGHARPPLVLRRRRARRNRQRHHQLQGNHR